MWRLLLGTMGVKSLVQGLNAAATAGFEPRTVWSKVRRRNRLTTAPPSYMIIMSDILISYGLNLIVCLELISIQMLLFRSLSGSPSSKCPSTWRWSNKYCFAIFESNMTFDKAEAFCQKTPEQEQTQGQLGGHTQSLRQLPPLESHRRCVFGNAREILAWPSEHSCRSGIPLDQRRRGDVCSVAERSTRLKDRCEELRGFSDGHGRVECGTVWRSKSFCLHEAWRWVG